MAPKTPRAPPRPNMTIQDDLEDIEDFYGDSKISKAEKLINAMKKKYPQAEFDAVAPEFFNLDDPENDKTLYNKIKGAYNGIKIKEQMGGNHDDYDNQYGAGKKDKKHQQVGAGCSFNIGRARCYTNKSDTVDEECVSTKGAKGRQGCKRNPNMMAATFSTRGETKKTRAYAKEQAAIEEAFNDPIFHLKFEQMGGECGLPGMGRRQQVGGECGYVPKKSSSYKEGTEQFGGNCGLPGKEQFGGGMHHKKHLSKSKKYNKQMGGYWSADGDDLIDPADTIIGEELSYEGGEQLGGNYGYEVDEIDLEQFGGGCRFVAGPGRCYVDGSNDMAPECIQTKGPKGKPGCSRRKDLVIHTTMRGAPGYTGRKMSEASKAKAAATRAANAAKRIAASKAAQLGGHYGYDDEIVEVDEVDQFGGGCQFNAGPGRCYSNSSNDFAPECVQTKGAKGKPGCARREGLVVPTARRAPGHTGRKVSEATKAKAAATRAANKALKEAEIANRVWVANPLFQEGGYWL